MIVKAKFFGKGVHVPDCKSLSKDIPIAEMETPDFVAISVAQHIGKPAEPIVAINDHVYQGQLIAKASGFVSANIYSSVSGVVTSIEKRPNVNGVMSDHIIIQNDNLYENVVLEPLADREPKTLINRICEAGIVGMGGAGFPTHVKLSPQTKVDCLVINGAECEPYLTCDYRLMIEKQHEVIEGIKWLAKALGVSKIYVGIEKNKPDAIEAFGKDNDLMVVPLKKAYPMGSEKHLIYSCTGRKVPTGKLPSDAGCVVQNIATALATYEAVELNKPLYERYMTVSGSGVVQPRNLHVKFGTRLDDIINFCGGLKEDVAMLISGGPMMGPTMISTDLYTTKTSSGLLALSSKEVSLEDPTPCINCGACASACPMNLLPMMIDFYTQAGDFDKADSVGGVMNCISCGTCAYVCPAKRALVQSITLAKNQIMAKRCAQQGGNK